MLQDLYAANPENEDIEEALSDTVGTGVLALAVLATAAVSAHRRKDTAS